MPLYIAIVALARYLILGMKNLETPQILDIGGTIILIISPVKKKNIEYYNLKRLLI